MGIIDQRQMDSVDKYLADVQLELRILYWGVKAARKAFAEAEDTASRIEVDKKYSKLLYEGNKYVRLI